jgi:hypothetical protein
MVNPQYLKAYTDHLEIINDLADTLKCNKQPKKNKSKAKSFTLNYLTDAASL